MLEKAAVYKDLDGVHGVLGAELLWDDGSAGVCLDGGELFVRLSGRYVARVSPKRLRMFARALLDLADVENPSKYYRYTSPIEMFYRGHNDGELEVWISSTWVPTRETLESLKVDRDPVEISPAELPEGARRA